MMDDNFEQALQEASTYFNDLFSKGITRKDIESTARSEMLRVFDDDFRWQEALSNADSDYDAYDSLKRHCAYKIRTEQQLDSRLKEWVAEILEDRRPPPRRKIKAKATGKKHNFLLASLVMQLSIKHDLKPTRNSESKEKLSACDAVSTAINQLPAERRLKPSSYSRLAEDYYHAHKVGHFKEPIFS